MRDYSKIYTSIWNSRKFQRLQSDDARLAYLYLHTCPSANSIGCFVLKDGYAAVDLGWDIERFHRALEALSKALLIGFHRPESLIRIVGFLAHDPFTNKNHAAGAIKLALSLPECDEKAILFKDIAAQKFTENLLPNDRAIDRAPIGLSKGYATPEPEPEPEKKEDGGGGSARGADFSKAGSQKKQTEREQILSAIGVDPVSGLTGHGGRQLGTQGDMAEAARWLQLPGLTLPIVIAEINRIMGGKRDGPPSTFKFFTAAMQRLSGQMAQEPLVPIAGTKAPPAYSLQIDVSKFNDDGSFRQ